MKEKTDFKPVDRRIQKTKKLLFDALMELILEKGYDGITVQDIIDKANVGRSTFYSHFENKEQLLYGSHQELRGMLFSENADGTLNFEQLYHHAKEHSQVAKAMLGKKGGDLVISYFKDALALKILNDINKESGKNKRDMQMKKLLAESTAAALTQLLSSWLDADMPFTVEDMADKSNSIYKSLIGLN